MLVFCLPGKKKNGLVENSPVLDAGQKSRVISRILDHWDLKKLQQSVNFQLLPISYKVTTTLCTCIFCFLNTYYMSGPMLNTENTEIKKKKNR